MNTHYSFWVKLATRASVFVALMLVIVKAGAWLATDSSSMLASLTDSMLDVLASLFTFFAVRYAVQPADNEHRFGHGKAESLAALVQSALIVGSALLILVHSSQQWLQGSPVAQHGLGIYVSLFAIAITLALVILQRVVIHKTGSTAIQADSLHFSSDLALNTAVIAALLFNAYGWYWADSAFAILIAIFLAYGACRIGWHAFQDLMDRELPDDERQLVIDTINSVKEIHGFHGLRTRSSGPARFVQCHIELEDELSLVAAHEIADEVERRVEALFPQTDMIVHVDPLSVVAAAMAETSPKLAVKPADDSDQTP